MELTASKLVISSLSLRAAGVKPQRALLRRGSSQAATDYRVDCVVTVAEFARNRKRVRPKVRRGIGLCSNPGDQLYRDIGVQNSEAGPG
jgi:hypothetical protein